MPNNLWKILSEDEATDGAPGVQGGPPRDPKMLPAEKDGDAKFVAGHMHSRGAPRITDIDKSTLDDKLFNASNIKRSVPLGGDNKHGHVPTGVDAKAYKSMSESVVTNKGADDLKAAGIQQVDSNSKEDMDAFDQLGPKTRNVLNYTMPVEWSSSKTLAHMKSQGMDPMHPAHDAMMAKHLGQAAGQIRSQMRMEALVDEVVGLLLQEGTIKKKIPQVPPLARQPKCEDVKVASSAGNSLIAEAAKSAKSAKPADRRTGYADDQDCEACHDRTLAFHDKALARGKAEMIHYGFNQDFGPDQSSIVSKTTAGKLTTTHDHGTGQIKHVWDEVKK